MRLPRWKPPVRSSRSRKPDGVPVISDVPLASASSLSISSWRISPISRKSTALLLVGDLEEQPLGVLDELGGLAVALRDRLLDQLGGRVEAAHQRVLLDDLRVVLGAAGCGDLGGQACDHVAAADLLELAVLGRAASETVRTSTGSAFSLRRMIAS